MEWTIVRFCCSFREIQISRPGRRKISDPPLDEH